MEYGLLNLLLEDTLGTPTSKNILLALPKMGS